MLAENNAVAINCSQVEHYYMLGDSRGGFEVNQRKVYGDANLQNQMKAHTLYLLLAPRLSIAWWNTKLKWSVSTSVTFEYECDRFLSDFNS